MAITLFPDGRIQKNGVEIGTQQGGGFMKQQWYMTATFTTSNVNSENIVTTDFAKNIDASVSWGSVGTESMTQSAGVFTFPSTGIYEVECKVSGSRSGGTNKYCVWRVYMSTDSGGSYILRSQGTQGMTNYGGTNTINIFTPTIVKVTNASTTRIRFATYGGNNNFNISSGGYGTSVTFKKLSEL